MLILLQDEKDWSSEEKRNFVDKLAAVCDDNNCTDETCCFVSCSECSLGLTSCNFHSLIAG